MNVAQLASLVSRSEIHQRVLGRYAGPYSLGVTRLNSNDQDAALHLRVKSSDTNEFPSEIEVQGEKIPVVSDGNWSAPVPQPARIATR
jgi:hypothetical protein